MPSLRFLLPDGQVLAVDCILYCCVGVEYVEIERGVSPDCWLEREMGFLSGYAEYVCCGYLVTLRLLFSCWFVEAEF